MKHTQKIIRTGKYSVLTIGFTLLVLFSRDSAAAVLKSGFYAGGGIQHMSANYGLTRYFDTQSSTSSSVRNTDDADQWQAPQLALGYQHLFGRLYLGAESSKSFQSNRLHDAYVQQTPINVTYRSDLRYNNLFDFDVLLGWAVTPSAVIYARTGLSYTDIHNDFNITYLFMNKLYTREASHTQFNRIGKDLGIGAAYQLSDHLMLQADYKITFYGQMHYTNMLVLSGDNYTPSRKTIALKTQSASIKLVYTFS